MKVTKESKQDWWHEILKEGPQKGWAAEDYVAAIERCLDEDPERELNELDSKGSTALHAAVKLSGEPAVLAATEALLRCGADINATDSNGKTPLAYLPIIHIGDVCAIYFVVRINLLAHLGLPVCSQNRQWYREWHDNVYGHWNFSSQDAEANGDDVDEISRYALYGVIVGQSTREIEALQNWRLNEWLTLDRVLFDPVSDEQLLPQLDDLGNVVRSDEFYDEFPDFGGLIKQRYRKALCLRDVRRKQLKALAMQAVEILVHLPDICNELIFSFLSFNDILILLQALEFDYEVLDRELGDDFDSVLEDIARLFL